ncbi:hypothetical protein ACJ5NV_04165 [Loktanella agnita]|uniref:hypothetical protein n=1 Tax=Loktanella agnita TaxID=287097 RepID=UPI00398815CC
MDIAEVQNEKSLRRYLEGLPEGEQREVAQRLAFRAAARVLPFVALYAGRLTGDHQRDDYVLLAFISVGIAGCRASGVAASYVPEIAPFVSRTAQAVATFNGDLAGSDAGLICVADALNAIGFAAYNETDYETAARIINGALNATSIAPVGAAASAQATRHLWPSVKDDLVARSRQPLWLNADIQRVHQDAWQNSKSGLVQESGADWSFWIAWYERALAGRDTLPHELAPIFNKLTEEDWEKGPAYINPMFDEVLALYRAEDASVPDLALRTPGTPEQIARTKTAMETHRRELPANCDAILSYITLEIERLQSRNYRDDAEMEETKRQITVLTTLHQAMSRLATLIPATDDMAQADAVEAEGLVRLYAGKFQEWPRANADEMVDNTCRFALVGLTAMMLPMVGVSATVATIAGAAFFGGERILKNINSAKDAFKPGDA